MTFRELAREILTKHTTEQADALVDRLSRALKQDPDRPISAAEEETIRRRFVGMTQVARACPVAEAAIKDFAVTELERLESGFN